jgi:hypothetical protein
MKKLILIVFLISSLLISAPGRAYYSQTDYTEIIEILPNWSAFLIPEVGANKDTQGQFGSIEYLKSNKVAMKRVQIPHEKLEGTSVWKNYYVPAARCVIVDRTPYQREWVASPTKGTSTKNEGFCFESADSINVEAGVVIAAYVTEDNAPAFLYWFGVRPPVGDPNDPNTMFTSIIYGRSLAEVMDTVVRGKVQAVMAREFGKYPLEVAIGKKAEIMGVVEKEVTDGFAKQGITISYLGLATSLNYDETVQKAINDRYIAMKMEPAIPVLLRQADIKVKEAFANALNKGIPQLPSFVVLPPSVIDLFTKMGTSNSEVKK